MELVWWRSYRLHRSVTWYKLTQKVVPAPWRRYQLHYVSEGSSRKDIHLEVSAIREGQLRPNIIRSTASGSPVNFTPNVIDNKHGVLIYSAHTSGKTVYDFASVSWSRVLVCFRTAVRSFWWWKFWHVRYLTTTQRKLMVGGGFAVYYATVMMIWSYKLPYGTELAVL